MPNIKNRISILKNATVFPAANFSYTENISEIAGIETWSKNLPGFGRYLNGKHLSSRGARILYLKTHPKRYIKGRYLYLGIMHEHFGHFLCESTSMMWAAKFFEAEVDGFIIILCADNARCCDFDKTFFRSICKIFSVNIKKIKFLDELVDVEHLIIPQIGHPPGLKPKKWYLDELKKEISRQNLIRSNFPKKIFVGRGDAYFDKTIAINYFRKILSCNNFYILYPEKFNILTQLSYILSADIIIWEEGSACHLCDLLPFFKEKESFIIKRRPTRSLADNAVISKFRNIKIYKQVEMIDIWPTKIHRNHISRFTDPQGLFKILKDCGYIKNNKFQYFNFILHELRELLIVYKKYLVIDVKSFFVKHAKPRVNQRFWAFLRKCSPL